MMDPFVLSDKMLGMARNQIQIEMFKRTLHDWKNCAFLLANEASDADIKTSSNKVC